MGIFGRGEVTNNLCSLGQLIMKELNQNSNVNADHTYIFIYRGGGGGGFKKGTVVIHQ